MADKITIGKFRRAIKRLAADEPKVSSDVWCTTQKQHWLGWLRHHRGPGAYGRKHGARRDAKFVYNHIVCVDMLVWLIEGAGIREDLHDDVRRAADQEATLQARSAAVRRLVPWSDVEAVL